MSDAMKFYSTIEKLFGGGHIFCGCPNIAINYQKIYDRFQSWAVSFSSHPIWPYVTFLSMVP